VRGCTDIAVVKLCNGILAGLTADTKPTTYPNGTVFIDIQTGAIWMYISSVWTAITSTTGEANTASNVGSGTGVFKSKSALDLQFKSLTATSSKIALANNTNDVGIDVTEANLTLSNMIGPLSVAKGGTGAATLTGILKGAGTSAITASALLAVADGGTGVGTLTGLVKGNGTSAMSAVTAPSGTVVGSTDTIALTNKTQDSKLNTFSNMPVHPSVKRTRSYQGAGNISTSCHGLLENNGATIAVGSGANSGVATTGGLKYVWTTGATINSICGVRFNTNKFMERSLNPLIEAKLQLRNGITTERAFFGFVSSAIAPVSAADPLANLSGVGFFYDSAVDTEWLIMQNDGSASSDSTTIINVATVDQLAHTFAIKAVAASNKFQYSYDGGAFVDINTKIPAANTSLGFNIALECTAASARTIDGYWIWCEEDG
jgi:hypothetical protein